MSSDQHHHLLHFYNYIYQTGIPSQWNAGQTVPVPKPGGLSFHLRYFRLITLVNCLSKVLEKMVYRRLQAFLESSTFYSPVQNGFRAGHSTLDSLSRLEYDARMALLRKHYCVAVFWTLSGHLIRVVESESVESHVFSWSPESVGFQNCWSWSRKSESVF